MVTVRRTAAEVRQGGRVDYAKLDATTEEDIRRHAIEDGEDYDSVPHDDWYPTPETVRRKLGLTQVAMAEAIRIPVATWRNWEQRRVGLDPTVRSLLWILWHEPEAALRALRPPIPEAAPSSPPAGQHARAAGG